MLWLLLTGQVPTVEQTKNLSQELAAKGQLPAHVEKIIDSFPKTLRECRAAVYDSRTCIAHADRR